MRRRSGIRSLSPGADREDQLEGVILIYRSGLTSVAPAKSTSTCSCVSVGPNASASMAPSTVISFPWSASLMIDSQRRRYNGPAAGRSFHRYRLGAVLSRGEDPADPEGTGVAQGLHDAIHVLGMVRSSLMGGLRWLGRWPPGPWSSYMPIRCPTPSGIFVANRSLSSGLNGVAPLEALKPPSTTRVCPVI